MNTKTRVFGWLEKIFYNKRKNKGEMSATNNTQGKILIFFFFFFFLLLYLIKNIYFAQNFNTRVMKFGKQEHLIKIKSNLYNQKAEWMNYKPITELQFCLLI